MENNLHQWWFNIDYHKILDNISIIIHYPHQIEPLIIIIHHDDGFWTISPSMIR